MSELESIIQKILNGDRKILKKLREIKNPNVDSINDVQIRFSAKYFYDINCQSEIESLSQQRGFFPLLDKLLLIKNKNEGNISTNFIESFRGQIFYDFTELTNIRTYFFLFDRITITDEFIKAMPISNIVNGNFLSLLNTDKKLLKKYWQKYSDQFNFNIEINTPAFDEQHEYTYEEKFYELVGDFNFVLEEMELMEPLTFHNYESLTIENNDCSINQDCDDKIIANDLLNLLWSSYMRFNNEKFINTYNIIEIFDLLDSEQRIIWYNRLKNKPNFLTDVILSESYTAIEMISDIFDYYRNNHVDNASFVFLKSYVKSYPQEMGIVILNLLSRGKTFGIYDILREPLTQKHIDEFVRDHPSW